MAKKETWEEYTLSQNPELQKKYKDLYGNDKTDVTSRVKRLLAGMSEGADRRAGYSTKSGPNYGPAPSHVPGPDKKKKFTAQDVADVKARSKPKMAKGGVVKKAAPKKAKKK